MAVVFHTKQSFSTSEMKETRDIIDLLVAFLLFTGAIYTNVIYIFPLASVYQERKLWLDDGMEPLNVVGFFKVYVYNLLWLMGSFLGCTLAVILRPITGILGSSSLDYQINSIVERAIGKLCQSTLGPVEIVGAENLPPVDNPNSQHSMIIAANHASQIDIGVSYSLDRRFKWISKRSVVYLPGVGMVMILGRHVLLNRKGKESIKKMYDSASYWLGKSSTETCPIFIFPQGTRSMSKRLPFKDGAFNMAIRDEVDIIPVSIDVPNNLWNDCYPFTLSPRKVVVTVHKAIEVNKNSDKAQLKKQCEESIYSVLPTHRDTAKSK